MSKIKYVVSQSGRHYGCDSLDTAIYKRSLLGITASTAFLYDEITIKKFSESGITELQLTGMCYLDGVKAALRCFCD